MILWVLRYGKDIEALESMAESGMSVPAIDQRPSITGGEWLWSAFWELNTCRQMGMSVGPIPWTAVSEYSAKYHLTTEEDYTLHHVISHMDGVYMKQVREQAEVARQQEQASRHSGARPTPKAIPRGR